MADEIKKVITIDTGQGITSLKEYKKHIDELRGSLLQLDKTSEEYKKTEEEIAREQVKLNEVLKAGKKDVDYLDGSYYQLNKQLVEAKKQWKELSEVERNGQVGQELLSKIQGLDKELKGLDASIGQFQRNVGNYQGAFEEAFKSALDGFSSLDGPLGDLAGSTKKLIPLIKATTKTATDGLSGIKKGLAATGIGVVIILVSQLIAHWKELTAFIGISEEQIGDFKTQALNTFKNIISGVVGVGNVLLQYLLTPIKTITQAFIGLGNIVKDIFTGDFAKIKEDATNALNGIKDAFTNGFNIKENFETGKAVGEQFIAGIETRIENVKARGKDKGKEVGSAIGKGAAEGVKEATEEVIDNTKELVEQAEREAKEQLKQYNRDLKELNDKAKQELFDAGLDYDNEQERAAKIYEIDRQLIVDKIQLQEDYLAAFLGDIDEQLAAEQQLADLKQELANLDKKRAKDVSTYETKQAQEAAKNKVEAYKTSVASISSLFGSISELFEEGSEQQKAFAIMEATINTIAGAIGGFMKASETYVAPYGQIIGAATAAAITASGIAQIQKIRKTTKENTNLSSDVPTAAISSIPNVGVNPLLNEGADIQNLTSLNVNPDSSNKSTRVYVLESDITEAQDNIKVKVDNSTF